MKMRNLLLPLLLAFSSTSLFAAQKDLNLNNAISIERISPAGQENYEYDFGSIPVGTLGEAYFTVTNSSNTTWTFKSGTIAGDYFYGEHSCGAGLKPKEQCDVAIYYAPEAAGEHQGAFELSFNPDLLIHVDLFGSAY